RSGTLPDSRLLLDNLDALALVGLEDFVYGFSAATRIKCAEFAHDDDRFAFTTKNPADFGCLQHARFTLISPYERLFFRQLIDIGGRIIGENHRYVGFLDCPGHGDASIRLNRDYDNTVDIRRYIIFDLTLLLGHIA